MAQYVFGLNIVESAQNVSAVFSSTGKALLARVLEQGWVLPAECAPSKPM